MDQENAQACWPARKGVKNARTPLILTAALVALLFLSGSAGAEPLTILFLGDLGPHQPAQRAQQIIPLMKARGIDMTYAENLSDLTPATLDKYDGLVLYADQEKIEPAQEKALLDYVAGGKGFIALHGASYCFLNSPKYLELVGARLKYHDVGYFSTRVVKADHPVMNDFGVFETKDETYVHTQPSQDCTVLLVRREGERDEPYAWVRTHGKGRVFYTAYGHDSRTWGNPAFQSLLEHGIRWACGSNSDADNTMKGENHAPKQE